jgi:UDP-N-acetyl-D-glucosamine dehydrogenase
VIRPSREHSNWAGLRSVRWDKETIVGYDAVLVATAHKAVDYRQLGEWARCIIDTRNALKGIAVTPGKLWKA